jgi:hypothetical protein
MDPVAVPPVAKIRRTKAPVTDQPANRSLVDLSFVCSLCFSEEHRNSRFLNHHASGLFKAVPDGRTSSMSGADLAIFTWRLRSDGQSVPLHCWFCASTAKHSISLAHAIHFADRLDLTLNMSDPRISCHREGAYLANGKNGLAASIDSRNPRSSTRRIFLRSGCWSAQSVAIKNARTSNASGADTSHDLLLFNGPGTRAQRTL